MPDYRHMLSEGRPTTMAMGNPAHHLGSREELGVKDRMLAEHNRLNLLLLGQVIGGLLQVNERTEG